MARKINHNDGDKIIAMMFVIRLIRLNKIFFSKKLKIVQSNPRGTKTIPQKKMPRIPKIIPQKATTGIPP